jgi:hypothetical protein
MERINSLSYLEDAERFALACAFSGSRWPPVFDAAIMVHFPAGGNPAGGEGGANPPGEEGGAGGGGAAGSGGAEGAKPGGKTATARQILEDPDTAFARGGAIHRAFQAFRDGEHTAGGTQQKIHTACYNPHPPPGSAGQEYTW